MSPKFSNPNTIEEAVALAQIVFKSKIYPHIGSVEMAVALFAIGADLGISPMAAVRGIHVIDGKPSPSAELVAGLAKRHPDCEFFTLVETSATVATYEAKRKGDAAPTRMSMTMADAKASGLGGRGPWLKYPAAMLRARVASSLARAVFPDALMALPEEDDHPDAPPSPQPDTQPARAVKDRSAAQPAPQPEQPQPEARKPSKPKPSPKKLQTRLAMIHGMDKKMAAKTAMQHLVGIGEATDMKDALRILQDGLAARGLTSETATCDDILIVWCAADEGK